MPLRKPLCMITVFFVLSMCTASFILGWEINEGIIALLSWLTPVIVAGYYGSSAYEHCNGPHKQEGGTENCG